MRTAANAVDTNAVIQTFGQPADNRVLIRTARANEGDLDAEARRVIDGLRSTYSENRVVESSSEVVGPVVGAELRRKAVLLTLFGLVFQIIYIAIRFKGAVWGLAVWLCEYGSARFGVCADERCGNVYLDTSSNCFRAMSFFTHRGSRSTK